MVAIHGQTLIRRACTAALDADCYPVQVVTGAVELADELAALDVQLIHNPNWSAGMGGSIRTGMEALYSLQPLPNRVMILLCDQIDLTSDILKRLLNCHRDSGLPAAACRYAGTIGPPCVFDQEAFDALKSISPAAGAKSLLSGDDVALLDWPAGAVDLDIPADLDRFSGRTS